MYSSAYLTNVLKGAEFHFVPTTYLECVCQESEDIFPCEDGSLSHVPSGNFWRPLLISGGGGMSFQEWEVVLWHKVGMKAREAAEKSILLGSTLPQSVGQTKNVNGTGT